MNTTTKLWKTIKKIEPPKLCLLIGFILFSLPITTIAQTCPDNLPNPITGTQMIEAGVKLSFNP